MPIRTNFISLIFFIPPFFPCNALEPDI